MIFFKYIFYRVYSFYNKRWPHKDPEMYGFYAVGITTVYWLMALSVNFSSLKIMDNVDKPTIALIILAMCIFYYKKFLSRDKYLHFCNEAYFQNTFLKNRRLGTWLAWTYALLPLLLLIIGIARAKQQT